jgi:hypothetical protein
MTHEVNGRSTHVTRSCVSREADAHVAYITIFVHDAWKTKSGLSWAEDAAHGRVELD